MWHSKQPSIVGAEDVAALRGDAVAYKNAMSISFKLDRISFIVVASVFAVFYIVVKIRSAWQVSNLPSPLTISDLTMLQV